MDIATIKYSASEGLGTKVELKKNSIFGNNSHFTDEENTALLIRQSFKKNMTFNRFLKMKNISEQSDFLALMVPLQQTVKVEENQFDTFAFRRVDISEKYNSLEGRKIEICDEIGAEGKILQNSALLVSSQKQNVLTQSRLRENSNLFNHRSKKLKNGTRNHPLSEYSQLKKEATFLSNSTNTKESHASLINQSQPNKVLSAAAFDIKVEQQKILQSLLSNNEIKNNQGSLNNVSLQTDTINNTAINVNKKIISNQVNVRDAQYVTESLYVPALLISDQTLSQEGKLTQEGKTTHFALSNQQLHERWGAANIFMQASRLDKKNNQVIQANTVKHSVTHSEGHRNEKTVYVDHSSHLQVKERIPSLKPSRVLSKSVDVSSDIFSQITRTAQPCVTQQSKFFIQNRAAVLDDLSSIASCQQQMEPIVEDVNTFAGKQNEEKILSFMQQLIQNDASPNIENQSNKSLVKQDKNYFSNEPLQYEDEHSELNRLDNNSITYTFNKWARNAVATFDLSQAGKFVATIDDPEVLQALQEYQYLLITEKELCLHNDNEERQQSNNHHPTNNDEDD